jgi:hypothetical protein
MFTNPQCRKTLVFFRSLITYLTDSVQGVKLSIPSMSTTIKRQSPSSEFFKQVSEVDKGQPTDNVHIIATRFIDSGEKPSRLGGLTSLTKCFD